MWISQHTLSVSLFLCFSRPPSLTHATSTAHSKERNVSFPRGTEEKGDEQCSLLCACGRCSRNENGGQIRRRHRRTWIASRSLSTYGSCCALRCCGGVVEIQGACVVGPALLTTRRHRLTQAQTQRRRRNTVSLGPAPPSVIVSPLSSSSPSSSLVARRRC